MLKLLRKALLGCYGEYSYVLLYRNNGGDCGLIYKLLSEHVVLVASRTIVLFVNWEAISSNGLVPNVSARAA